MQAKGYVKTLTKRPMEGWSRRYYEIVQMWLMKYPEALINQLEAQGVTWAWVNDASLQEAQLDKDGRINIRRNLFKALILANDSIIHLKTAEKIKLLANKGMHLLVTGKLPTKQPSFMNWKANDQKTSESIVAALKGKNTRYIQEANKLKNWINQISQPVKFKDEYRFTRQAVREMSDGSRIHFVCNKSERW